MFKVALLLIAASVVALASANAIEGKGFSLPKNSVVELFKE